MTITMMRVNCGEAGGVKADGTPCASMLGLSDAGLCSFHDPERADAAQAMRSRGGIASAATKRRRREAAKDDERRRKGVPKRPDNLEEASAFSSWAFHAVASGEIDGDTNRSIQYGVSVFKSTIEKRDLERRIKQLTKQVEILEKEVSR